MHWHYIINFYEFYQRIYLIFLEEFIWCVFSPVDARRWVLCVCVYHFLELKKKIKSLGQNIISVWNTLEIVLCIVILF